MLERKIFGPCWHQFSLGVMDQAVLLDLKPSVLEIDITIVATAISSTMST